MMFINRKQCLHTNDILSALLLCVLYAFLKAYNYINTVDCKTIAYLFLDRLEESEVYALFTFKINFVIVSSIFIVYDL